ncbi:MAG TPA: hypothetical protein VF897_25700 [Roseiflexaceae bacterium]
MRRDRGDGIGTVGARAAIGACAACAAIGVYGACAACAVIGVYGACAAIVGAKQLPTSIGIISIHNVRFNMLSALI